MVFLSRYKNIYLAGTLVLSGYVSITSAAENMAETGIAANTPVVSSAPIKSQADEYQQQAPTSQPEKVEPTPAITTKPVESLPPDFQAPEKNVPQVNCEEATPEPVLMMESEEQKRAYASGVALAHFIDEQLAQQKALHITLNKELLLSGITDTFRNQSKMSDQEIKSTLADFDEQVRTLMLAEANKRLAKQNEFVTAFAQRDGVKKSRKGWYYLIEDKGEGRVIKDNDTVTVTYKGTLLDGTVIDEPHVKNAIQHYKVKEMTPILRESVKLIHKGGQIQIVIPPVSDDRHQKPSQYGPDNSLLIYTLSVLDLTE